MNTHRNRKEAKMLGPIDDEVFFSEDEYIDAREEACGSNNTSYYSCSTDEDWYTLDQFCEETKTTKTSQVVELSPHNTKITPPNSDNQSLPFEDSERYCGSINQHTESNSSKERDVAYPSHDNLSPNIGCTIKKYGAVALTERDDIFYSDDEERIAVANDLCSSKTKRRNAKKERNKKNRKNNLEFINESIKEMEESTISNTIDEEKNYPRTHVENLNEINMPENIQPNSKANNIDVESTSIYLANSNNLNEEDRDVDKQYKYLCQRYTEFLSRYDHLNLYQSTNSEINRNQIHSTKKDSLSTVQTSNCLPSSNESLFKLLELFNGSPSSNALPSNTILEKFDIIDPDTIDMNLMVTASKVKEETAINYLNCNQTYKRCLYTLDKDLLRNYPHFCLNFNNDDLIHNLLPDWTDSYSLCDLMNNIVLDDSYMESRYRGYIQPHFYRKNNGYFSQNIAKDPTQRQSVNYNLRRDHIRYEKQLEKNGLNRVLEINNDSICDNRSSNCSQMTDNEENIYQKIKDKYFAQRIVSSMNNHLNRLPYHHNPFRMPHQSLVQVASIHPPPVMYNTSNLQLVTICNVRPLEQVPILNSNESKLPIVRPQLNLRPINVVLNYDQHFPPLPTPHSNS